MSKLTFDEDRALELYNQGHNDSEIGQELGVKMTAVGAWRNRRGLARNLPPEKHGTRPEVTVEIPEGLKSVNESEPRPPEPVEELPVEESLQLKAVQEALAPVKVSFAFSGCTVSLTAEDPTRAMAGARYLANIVEAICADTAPIFIKL